MLPTISTEVTKFVFMKVIRVCFFFFEQVMLEILADIYGSKTKT